MMKFIEVAVADRGLKTHQTLTYSTEEDVAVGSIVRGHVGDVDGFEQSELSVLGHQRHHHLAL